MLIDYENFAISLRGHKVSETNVRRENCFSRQKRRMSLAFREIGRFSRALAQDLFYKVILRDYSQSKRLLTFLPLMLGSSTKLFWLKLISVIKTRNPCSHAVEFSTSLTVFHKTGLCLERVVSFLAIKMYRLLNLAPFWPSLSFIHLC